jgi:aryl-alcohol dehydrogenase-like predicted oxidoreductase
MQKGDAMEFRRLGRSGIKVSPLGLETARMAGLGFQEEGLSLGI